MGSACPAFSDADAIVAKGFQFIRGIGLHTPADVHYGLADTIHQTRKSALEAARAANPERFNRNSAIVPKALQRPSEAWINKPKENQETPPNQTLTTGIQHALAA